MEEGFGMKSLPCEVYEIDKTRFPVGVVSVDDADAVDFRIEMSAWSMEWVWDYWNRRDEWVVSRYREMRAGKVRFKRVPGYEERLPWVVMGVVERGHDVGVEYVDGNPMNCQRANLRVVESDPEWLLRERSKDNAEFNRNDEWYSLMGEKGMDRVKTVVMEENRRIGIERIDALILDCIEGGGGQCMVRKIRGKVFGLMSEKSGRSGWKKMTADRFRWINNRAVEMTGKMEMVDGQMFVHFPERFDLERARVQAAAVIAEELASGVGAVRGRPSDYSFDDLAEIIGRHGMAVSGIARAAREQIGMSRSTVYRLFREGKLSGRIVCRDGLYRMA